MLTLDDAEIPMDSASNKPWRGFVVTFSGIEDKPALAKLARELGAEVESALTVKVTHVVAQGFTSPKYHVRHASVRELIAVCCRAPSAHPCAELDPRRARAVDPGRGAECRECESR